MKAEEFLRGLHDIQIPGQVALWPPAPGWWVLGLVLVAALASVLWLWWRRLALRRAALRELARLESAFRRDGDGAALARGISGLLRRVALARSQRSEVAGLCDEAWLAWLDRRGGGDAFRRGSGRALATAPYRRDTIPVSETLAGVARRWIRLNT
ncbi:MAG: DUF4381 domain-containing protein [Pseudomonadota bacterium]|nr:DUF4381 domain-containing protein [Pseudomonadota bacterium]